MIAGGVYCPDDWPHSRPARCKTGLAIARHGQIVHRVAAMRSFIIDGRVQFAARWVCSAGPHSGTLDAVLLADPEPLGGVCRRCDSIVLGCVVYRCYDADERLLYIGSTGNSYNRFTVHQRKTRWWPEVARIAMAKQPDIETARRVEALAILAEKPLRNRSLDKERPPFDVLIQQISEQEAREPEPKVPAA